MHSISLEIDSVVLINTKGPAKECPNLVHPHPLFSLPQPDTAGKKIVSFDDWKVEYSINLTSS